MVIGVGHCFDLFEAFLVRGEGPRFFFAIPKMPLNLSNFHVLLYFFLATNKGHKNDGKKQKKLSAV